MIISMRDKKKPESVWDVLLGKKIIVQAKSGVRYEGELVAFKDGYIVLMNALITGKKFTVKTNLLAVHHSLIAHLHTEPIAVELKEEQKPVE